MTVHSVFYFASGQSQELFCSTTSLISCGWCPALALAVRVATSHGQTSVQVASPDVACPAFRAGEVHGHACRPTASLASLSAVAIDFGFANLRIRSFLWPTPPLK